MEMVPDMKPTFRQLLLIFTVLILCALLSGCGLWRSVKTVRTGTDNPTTIDKSPVSGKELETAKQQLEIDARLLELCPVLPPVPKGARSSVDASSIMKNETSMYYACMYRHNALVRFLATKLGIVAGPKEQP